jgi:hypothetical protein
MTATETLIQKSLENSYSYADYRHHVTALLQQGLSTGNTQSEALTHYSTLNEARMNRLDKTIHLTDEASARLKTLTKRHILMVITEGWCGDAAQIVPVINKLAQVNDALELRLVLRDENETLMDEYLTNGARSIPKLVVVEKDTLMPRGSWGPRPHGAAALIADYKARPEGINEEAKTELQKWYLHDKGQSTIEEIMLLLENVEQS